MPDSLDAPVGVEDRPDTPEPSRPVGWSFARAADWARSRGPVARACAAVLLYAVVSVVAYGREALPHFGSHCLTMCATDTNYFIWSLQWMSHALAHGLNPFHTNVLTAPGSLDLTWAVTVPGPAFILAPVTWLFGPVATDNLLLVLAPVLAGWAAYLVCNRVTRRFWPSVVGGFVFGFSPYVEHYMRAQLHALLVFPAALAVYLVLRRMDGSMGKRAFVILLALVLILQISISAEIFASMTLFGAIALAGVLAFEPKLRKALWSVTGLIAAAYVAVAVVLVPYLLELFRNAPTRTIRDPAMASADLLSFVIPKRGMLVGGTTFYGITRKFVGTAEMAYLGPVFILILLLFAWEGRRRRSTWLLLGFIAVCALLSLGPKLHVDGAESVGMPGALLTSLPFMHNSLPERWVEYMWIAIAVITAMWLTRGSTRGRWIRYLLVGVALVFTIQEVNYPPAPTQLAVPAFFTDGTYRSYLHPGEIVLPVTKYLGNDFLWQAKADMYYRMPQGSWPLVRIAEGGDIVRNWTLGTTSFRHPVTPPTPASLRGLLEQHHVDAIVATDEINARWRVVLRSVVSSNPISVDGVIIYRVG